MIAFAISYFKALGCLLVALVVYSLLVVPWIEPKSLTKQAPIFEPTLPTNYWWQDFFPEGSWQNRDAKIIYTDRGILISQRWEPEDKKTWKLEPLTMIMPQSQAGREALQRQQLDELVHHDMWIISAEKGATIHLQDPLEKSTIPTIVRGDLSGAIEVTRRTAGGHGERPWKLRTSDLTINRTQVSTRHEVLIEWGDSVIQGRELRILLRNDLLASQTNKSVAWGPLDELELYHVDRIDVALPPGGIWANLDPELFDPRLQQQSNLTQLPARLRATCEGRFAFDFKRSVATLQNGVQVQHQLGQLTPDEFVCEKISFFVDPQAQSPAQSADSASKAPQLAGIQINVIEAVGADSIGEFVGEKWVELQLPTIDLTSRSKTLKADLLQRRIALAGRLEHDQATRSTVILSYRGHEVRTPHLAYQAPPDTQDGPAHLGWLVAEGPGELHTADTDNRAATNPPTSANYHSADTALHSSLQAGLNDPESLSNVHIRWQESLKMMPAPQHAETQWIELLGNTLIESPQRGFLTSERLEIWLQREDRESLISAAPLRTDDHNQQYIPKRIFSASPTVLATPSLKAQIEQLDLILEYPEAVVTEEAVADQLPLADSSGSPGQQWIDSPDQSTGKASPLPATNQAATQNENPIVVSGDKLRAIIASSGDDTWIDRMQLSGPVNVRNEIDTRSEELPWQIDGSLLLLATDRAGNADLQIEGAPATMMLADGSIHGDTIRLNQAHNLVLMDNPGEFTIPLSMLQRGQDSYESLPALGAEANSLQGIRWFNAPRCRWKGRMYFDGSIARVEGDIDFDAALRSSEDAFWWIAGTCQQLEIHLAQHIEMNSHRAQPAELDKIVLGGGVHIAGEQLNAEGEKKSREQILVPTLTFHAGSGRLVGTGPGSVHSRFLSDAQLGRLASSGAMGKAAELRGSYLTFRDSIVGLLESKEITFDGKIELLTGPIENWEDAVYPEQIAELEQNQLLLNCDQLKVYDTDQLGPPTFSSGAYLSNTRPSPASTSESWEFKAAGHVAFNWKAESSDISGHGYELKFINVKDQLILNGDRRTAAYIQSVPRLPGEATVKAFLQSVAINTKSLDILDLEPAPGGIQVEPSGQPNQALPAPLTGRGNPMPGPQDNIPNPRDSLFRRN